VWMFEPLRRESGQLSLRLHFTNKHPIQIPSAAFAKLSALTAGPIFVSPMDLRSPRLVRQLPGTPTQIPTPRCGPLRCDLRSTSERASETTGGQSDPAQKHFAPFVYGMKDRQTQQTRDS
jgi:hypothetical protein